MIQNTDTVMDCVVYTEKLQKTKRLHATTDLIMYVFTVDMQWFASSNIETNTDQRWQRQ